MCPGENVTVITSYAPPGKKCIVFEHRRFYIKEFVNCAPSMLNKRKKKN